MKRVVQVGVCVAALLMAAGAGAAPSTISSFDTTILLDSEGSAIVIERIELVQTLKEFERRIRISSSGPLMNETFFVDVAEVTDGAGKQLRYDTRIADGQLRIRVHGSTANGLRIVYGIRNAVRFFFGHDEFYWPAVAAQLPVQKASVHVFLPDPAAGQFSAQAFVRRGRTSVPKLAQWSIDGRVPLQITGPRLDVSAPGPLAGGVDLVVNVFVTKGVLQPPSIFRRAGWFIQNNPIVLFPLVAFVVMAAIRRLKGGDADPGRSIAPMYAPPEGLSPAEAGMLLEDRFDPRDVTATLVDLAVRGYIRIEETKPPQGWPVDSKDYIFRLLKPMFLVMPTPEGPGIPSPEWAKLAPHEQTMLLHTFYGGHWTQLSSLRLRFYDIVPRMRVHVLCALKEKGMYRVDPDQAHWLRQIGVGGVAAALLIAQLMGMSVWESPILGMGMIIASAVIVFAMGRKMTAKTRRGMRAYIAVRGFQQFMNSVEGDKLRRIEFDLFEKYMPYAMALGIEHRWAGAFAGITTKPDWYQVGDAEVVDAVVFGNRMDWLAQQTRATMAVTPRVQTHPKSTQPGQAASAGS